MAVKSGGYDYEFVDTPSDALICRICHHPSREPQLSACCGHTFCKSCLEAAERSEFVIRACPMCRSEEFSTMPNKQSDRIIRSLVVYCSNKNKGCGWQGEMNDITSHLSNSTSGGCQFHEVDCPNECGTAYQRRHHTSHLETECPRRMVNCQYCHDTAGEHQFIEGQHKDDCPKFPIPCPNNCKFGNVPRDKIQEHTAICPLQSIFCQYYLVGCEDKMARKDQNRHNKKMMGKHFSLSVGKLAEQLADTEISMKQKLRAQQDYTKQLLSHQHDAERTIQDLTNKLAAAEKEIVTLKQQLVTLTVDNEKALAKADIEIKKATQESITKLHSELQFLIWCGHFDIQAEALLSGNSHLPVVVKMTGFSEKKEHSIQWFSDPFYTHLNGYKMQLSVIPDGDTGSSKSSHMTVSLYLVKGLYDEQLEWPMKGEYEVKLLDQVTNSIHHSVTSLINRENSNRPTTSRNQYASWYSQMFISHKTLTTTNNFIKKDTLYFKVF